MHCKHSGAGGSNVARTAGGAHAADIRYADADGYAYVFFGCVFPCVRVCMQSIITQLPRDMHSPCVLTDGAASMPPGMMGMPPGMMGPGSKRYTWCCV